MTTLHNSMSKEEFKDVLYHKTYTINVWDDRNYNKGFLSKIEGDKIFVYHAGKGNTHRIFEADLEEDETGTVIKGEFLLMEAIRKPFYVICIIPIFLWILSIVVSLFVGRLANSFEGLISLPVFFAVVFFVKSKADKENEQAIYAFLENLSRDENETTFLR